VSAENLIDRLDAPLFVSWQMTRDCNLACLHCCTESAPGKALPDELDAAEALRVAREIAAAGVPYVMLCGGEPMILEHFFDVAEILGEAGVMLKVETNAHRLDAAAARRLARLPLRSIQISLDGDSAGVYARQRPGGKLDQVHAGCRAARDAGLPLEITFAPTRLNIDEAEAVIERALEFGAFRFNTGRLMRIGTAARLWHKLEPTGEQYRAFRAMLDAKSARLAGKMELCYQPFSVEEGLRGFETEPPATILLLPNGCVKVAAALPQVCADLRLVTFAEAWQAYCRAWGDTGLKSALKRAIESDIHHVEANAWRPMATRSA
jgi:MoaA/NifB/PqqE/SkfB family radical SAM enzyme